MLLIPGDKTAQYNFVAIQDIYRVAGLNIIKKHFTTHCDLGITQR